MKIIKANEVSNYLYEDIKEEPLYKKSNGDLLIKSDSGYGYTAVTSSDVIRGHISAENDQEAINKFISNKFDESFSDDHSLEEPLNTTVDEDAFDGDFYLDDSDLLTDDECIIAGKSFIEGGIEYRWLEREGDSLLIDFDYWGVWKAESEDGEEAWFVVELDTGFIDWGPCDTFEEAHDFMMSKADEDEDDDDLLYDDDVNLLNI
jgi:hypothetical protein